MTVREYLHQTGMTKDELSNLLGHQTTSSVTKKMEVEMPKRWVRLLDEADGSSTAVGGSSEADFDARTHKEREPLESWETVGRDSDQDPRKEDTVGTTVIGPQQIKLTTVEGYIKQIYGGAAYIARNRGDSIAADTITAYTDQFSEGWINYIESDPRIMAYLEKLMIGTPLGNLIGVHVIAIGSYVFARAAARELATAVANAGENGGTTEHGSGFSSSPDYVG